MISFLLINLKPEALFCIKTDKFFETLIQGNVAYFWRLQPDVKGEEPTTKNTSLFN